MCEYLSILKNNLFHIHFSVKSKIILLPFGFRVSLVKVSSGSEHKATKSWQWLQLVRKGACVKRQKEFNLDRKTHKGRVIRSVTLQLHHTEVRVLFYNVMSQHGLD